MIISIKDAWSRDLLHCQIKKRKDFRQLSQEIVRTQVLVSPFNHPKNTEKETLIMKALSNWTMRYRIFKSLALLTKNWKKVLWVASMLALKKWRNILPRQGVRGWPHSYPLFQMVLMFTRVAFLHIILKTIVLTVRKEINFPLIVVLVKIFLTCRRIRTPTFQELLTCPNAHQRNHKSMESATK